MQVVPGVIAIGIGAFALFASKSSRETRTEMLEWPSVQGEITERELVRRPSAGGRGTSYMPAFRYRYSVEGADHAGDTRDQAWSTGYMKRIAERKLYDLPDEVPVYYDPSDPARSALAPPGRSDTWVWIAFGLGLIALGVLLLVT